MAKNAFGKVKRSDFVDRFDHRFQKFLENPAYKRGVEKVDLRELHETFERLKDDYAAFINFYTYRRYMKAAKLRRGHLSGETERILGDRGEQAVEAYERMAGNLGRISEHLQSSGLEEPLNKHTPEVMAHLRYNPKAPSVMDEFREMGVPEHAIGWLLDRLAENDYDVLRYGRGDGTFSGLARRAEEMVPRLRTDVDGIRQRGLGAIEGAGEDEDEYVEAAVVTGIAIIVGLIFGFCHDWRGTGLPHVRHWEE